MRTTLSAAACAAAALLAVSGPAAAAPLGVTRAGNATIAAARPALPSVPGTIARISRTPDGTAPDAASDVYGATPDGRYVVYTTTSSQVVAGDTNGVSDVFRYDRKTATVQLVSRTASGGAGNGASSSPDITADGRYVTFVSTATDLAGAAQTSADPRLYRYDASTGTITSLTGPGGLPVLADLAKVTSPNGRWIGFQTGTSLTADDGNQHEDVYRLDVTTGRISLVSTTYDQAPVDGDSYVDGITNDGTVGYLSTATNLVAVKGLGGPATPSLYLARRGAASSVLVTHTPVGKAPNGPSFGNLSADGSEYVFSSQAGNLVKPTGPMVTDRFQLFVYDVATDTTTAVSRDFAGFATPSSVGSFGISANGRHIAYSLTSGSDDPTQRLVTYDVATGTSSLPVGTGPNAGGIDSSFDFVSNDGTRATFETARPLVRPATDTNNATDVFTWTRS